MRPAYVLCALALATSSLLAEDIPNRLIDYKGFLVNAAEVNTLRQQHRITEAQFLEMARDPSTIILDARSEAKYRLLHLKGAVNLSLPDFTAGALAAVIPNKDTRILIYCNNNFLNEPRAFDSKAAPTSLNIYTFNSLYSYGYKNVYELGPLLDVKSTILPFEGANTP